MAFWGWPATADNADPGRQVDAALKAARKIRRDFQKLREANRSALRCGIGLAHGEAVAGRLGVRDQCKLDVFGPVVNLASRLESLTKHFGVEILVDEAITRHLEKQKEISSRVLARIKPVGIAQPLLVSEVMAGDWMNKNYQTPALWKTAVEAFRDGKWENARRALQQYLARIGKPDTPTDILLDTIGTQSAPPENWSGVLVMEKK